MATFTQQDQYGKIKTIDVVIANGGSLSTAVDLIDNNLVGIQFPAAWTAASLTFQGSKDNSTFADLFDAAGELTITAAVASRLILLTPSQYAAVRYLKLRSGISGAAVNQGADRTLTLLLRGI